MTIVLPAFGVAFAAFAVWLTVRIVNGRKPTVRFILLAVGTIGALLGAWAFIVHRQYREQMQAIAVVERLGGAVHCRRDAPMWLQRLQPDLGLPWRVDGLGPNWLREWLPAT